MAGIGLGVEIEVIQMNEVGFHLYDRISYNFLEIVDIFLVGKTGIVTEGLLVAIREQNGQAGDVSLNPVLGARLLGKEGLVHHGAPLNIGVRLHAIAVGDGNSISRLLHPLLFSGHAKAFIKAGVEDLDSLVMKLSDKLFAQLVPAGLERVSALPAAAHNKNMRLVRAAGIHHTPPQP